MANIIQKSDVQLIRKDLWQKKLALQKKHNLLWIRQLLKWYDANPREMPWRGSRDPYVIWLSEVLLQQTRVKQGTPYFVRFLAAYPTVEALADATLEEVLLLWQGLGYYRRAHFMHQTAKQVAQQGRWPKDMDALKRLPGVGAYTAAAIASIAFDIQKPVVDGNVIRVLSRAFGAPAPYDQPSGMRWIQSMASELLSSNRPGDYNQAIMDMGAVLCTPRKPKCEFCFWLDRCVARLQGRIAELPAKSRRKQVVRETLNYSVLLCRGHVALFKRPEQGIWAGLYEFLMVETLEETERDACISENHPQKKRTIKHALSHRALTIHLTILAVPVRPTIAQAVWVRLEHLKQFPMPRPLELYAKELTLKYGRTQQSHAHRQPRQRPGGQGVG
jgi:A/G-specific adenine glycosylase